MKRRGNVRSSEKKGNGKKVVVSMILLIVAAFLAVPYLKGQAKSSFHRLKKGDK